MTRCPSRRPVGAALQCARTVPHSRHANCSLWWDDDGTVGQVQDWPRTMPPLYPPTAPTVTP